MLVDTHCHIQSAGKNSGERITLELWAKSPELSADQIITNAKTAGVERMICVGCDLEDSKLAINFVQDHDKCYASIGIHPHEARAYVGQADKLKEFSSLVSKPKVVAVGECGLDYFYEHSPREAQAEILKFQIGLALENNLPMIFHVREAFDDFWPIFESYRGVRGVLHSFTDSEENMERAINHGLLIGVNGIATFTKNLKQLDVYKAIPLDNLLLETDAPFLAPKPFRGQTCEPKHVRATAEFLAKLRSESFENIAEATTQNARKLFGF